ncbi:MAG: TetR/AcrR family transcriptional regulator [Bacteroidales bacterium]|nr:TetR/AcrR family transcriptional regulator [Bacteroidales bacterium]
MIELKEKKLQELYQYYLDNGADHTMEEIAAGIGVTPKTIFNRYHSREEMEDMLQTYWRTRIIEKWKEKQPFCNNPIENLLFLLNEMLISEIQSSVFFLREQQLRSDFSEEIDDLFSSSIREIIEADKNCTYFSSSFNSETYSRYFVYVVFFILSKDKNAHYIDYLFKPILTDQGLDMLSDIDIETFLN